MTPLALVLAGLAFACSDAPLSFLSATLATDGADAWGPYALTAALAGGTPPLRVDARFTVAGPEALEGACADEQPERAWRGVDAGVGGACWAFALAHRGGGVFQGATEGGPFLPGTTLHYRLRATDADGHEALWPADGPAQLTVALPSPEVLAVAPPTGPLAGGTRVALRGVGFTEAVAVRFGDLPATAVEVASGELVVAVAPPGRGPGSVDVVVTTAAGDARAVRAFRYLAPPEVLRVAPPEGPTSEETLVVIDGRAFEEGARVLFGDADGLRTEVLDPQRLSTFAPPHSAATVEVVVINPDDQRGGLDAAFTWWPAPEIVAVTPNQGPDLGGTALRIEGRFFRAPATVWLGAHEATLVGVEPSGTVATAVTPAQPAGRVELRLYNPDGQVAVAPMLWRVIGPPVLVAAEPPVISRCGGGLTVLVGENFDPAMQVRINGVLVEVVEVSDDGTRATVRTVAGEPGPATVEVLNPDGRGARSDVLVVYGVQPVVRAITPDRVPVWGGVTVRIEGADLEQGVEVRFDEVAAERTVVRQAGCDAVLDVVVPPHAAGPAAVIATTAEGQVGTLPGGVTYVAPTLEPPTGLVPGYANIELRGVDLRPGLRLTFGDRAPRVLERVSDERWRVVTPPGERGPVAVDVRNADGRGVRLTPGFHYRIFVDETAGRLDATGDCNDAEVGDFNGDGRPDVAVANGGLSGVGRLEQAPSLYLNDGAGRLRREDLRPVGNGLNVKAGDADGDGDLDLLVANLSSPTSHFFRNQGRGRMVHEPGYTARASAYDATFLDLEGDGDLDVLLLRNGSPDNNAFDGPERLFRNTGGGNLVDISDQFPFDLRDVHDHDVEVGDLNGDGAPDVVIVVDTISPSFSTGRNRLLLNDGTGRFREAPSPFNDYPGDWLDVELVDIDADGDLDVLVPQDFIEGFSRPGTPALAVFLNDGRAHFEEATDLIHGLPPLPAFEVVATDLDGDGDVDLAVAIYGYLFSDGSIEAFRSALLLNDGTGNFFESSGAFERGLDLPTADFADADFDGDGALDLMECAAQGQSRLWMQRE